MNLEEIKTEVAGMSKEQQDRLAANLVHLRHRRESGRRQEITARIEDKDPGNWIPLDRLKEEGTD